MRRRRAAAPSGAMVIGGSAGALAALKALLRALSPDCPVPIAVVVHVPDNRTSMLRDVLAKISPLPVREGEDKEAFLPGGIYVAPSGYHMLIEKDHTLSLSLDPPVHFSRPSIDVLFESAADAFGKRLVGVLLSGASADGALGLLAIHRAGGRTYIQSPESAQVSTMPQAGLACSPDSKVLSLDRLVDLFRALSSAGRAEGAEGDPWPRTS